MKTNSGIDWIANQIGGTGGTATANFLALTANSAAPLATSTSLPGEITTAGGGLIRGVATYAHTTGTAIYTLSRTVIANGSDALPVTVAKIGWETAVTAGTHVFETLLNATATFSLSGDSMTASDTFTIS